MSSRVLIVEDEALIAMSLEMQLQDMGFDTIVASSIAAASSAVAQGGVDVAILDYALKGGETTTRLAELLREDRVPFVVCSGSQRNDIASIFDGVTIIPKPFTNDALADAVISALQERAQRPTKGGLPT